MVVVQEGFLGKHVNHINRNEIVISISTLTCIVVSIEPVLNLLRLVTDDILDVSDPIECFVPKSESVDLNEPKRKKMFEKKVD